MKSASAVGSTLTGVHRNFKVKAMTLEHNGKNLGSHKALIETRNAIAVEGSNLSEVLTVRWYTGFSRNARTVYCSIWIRGWGNQTGAGHGRSLRGSGGSRTAEAFEAALRDAGVELTDSVHSSETIDVAMDAVLKALGYIGQRIIISS